MKKQINFDMEAALKALRDGKDLSGQDGVLTPLIKQLTEAAMQAELEAHLAEEELPNRKNGRTAKTMKSAAGSFVLETPRDRAGTFDEIRGQYTQFQILTVIVGSSCVLPYCCKKTSHDPDYF